MKLQIETKAPKVGKEATVEYEVGASLAESAQIFGEQIVNDVFNQQLVVKIQAGVRTCLEQGKDPVAWAAVYKPGVRGPAIAKDPKLAARAAIGQMSVEEKLEFIKENFGEDAYLMAMENMQSQPKEAA